MPTNPVAARGQRFRGETALMSPVEVAAGVVSFEVFTIGLICEICLEICCASVDLEEETRREPSEAATRQIRLCCAPGPCGTSPVCGSRPSLGLRKERWQFVYSSIP